MNAELNQLLQNRQSHQNQNNGNSKRHKLTRDKSVDEGSLDILEHLIAVILQENAAYLEKLLQNSEVLDVIDMQDNKGFAPLHIACDKYDVECCRLLLQAGANSNIADNYGRTALHWVVSAGCHCESCNTKRANCTKLLIQSRTNIEAEDQNGETPLFYATNHMLTKSAVVLLESGAEISKTNSKGVNLGQLIVQKIPFVMTQLLDSCIAYDDEDNSELRIDFTVLLESAIRVDDAEGGFELSKSRTTATMVRSKRQPQNETELLTCMLKAFPIGRELLLTHPVTETFIHLKWLYVRKWFWFIRLFYCLVTLLYSYFIFTFYIHQCPYHGNNDGFMRSSDLIARPLYPCQQTPLELGLDMYIMIGCVSLGLLAMFLNQLNSICYDTASYFRSGINIGWWILIISSLLTILPPVGLVSLNYWIYPLAAFSIFWAWAMHLAHLNRIPFLGSYVEMLGKALQKMCIIGCIYSSLFVAFVLGFCVLFPQHSMFEQIPNAAVKVFLMMVGDREYERIFNNTSEEGRLLDVDYAIPAHLFYVAFIIIFGILMINLLVGLAVSDIQELRRDAELTQVCRQITEIARLEKFLTTNWFCCCRKSFLSIMSVEGRNGRYFNFSPTDPYDQTLPSALKAKFIPYLPTRSCLKKMNVTTSKARWLQRHSSLETQLHYQQPFYSNDNLETILTDLKIRLEGLTRMSTTAAVNVSLAHARGSRS